MANGNVTMLNALNLNHSDCTIKVKVVKVWRRKKNGEENKFYSIDMTLMDEQGNKICASCLYKFFFRFEKYFIQDDYLLINRPSLADNRSNFKLVNNDHKVTFCISTSVRKCNDWAGTQHCFHFTDFKSILGKSTNEEDNTAVGAVIDLIGHVLICYDIEDTDTKLGPGKRLNLKLKDLDDEVVGVTLWDDFALEMHAFMSRKDRNKDVFLLIQFGALKIHQGKRTVSNAFNATRLFINSDIDEIVGFKNRFLAKYANLSSLSGHDSGSVMITSVEDVFLNSEYSPIAFVSIINEEKHVVVVGTINGICNKKLWYYEACTVCHCKVEKEFITIEKPDGTVDVADRKVFKCSNKSCNAEEVTAKMRFKIPVIVQDSTGSVSLTLFNREAFKLIRKSAEDVVNRQEKSDEFEEFPIEFKEFIGKRFAFHIKVTKYNIDHNIEYFAIDKLSNDSDILSKLDQKHAIGQNDEYESNGASTGDIQDKTVSLKDALSSSDENVTPMSNLTEVPPKVKFGDLKRNLEEVYKEEDLSGADVIEADKKEEKHAGRASVKKKMVVPKKEK